MIYNNSCTANINMCRVLMKGEKMRNEMARKGKLKKWFVSMLSGVIVTTTVMGTSVVAFAVDDNQQQLEENQNGQGDNNTPDTENQDQSQDAATSYSSADVPQQETTAEPKVTEVIVETGNGLVKTTNPDSSQTASYDKKISGMLTEESTQAVIDEKTAEQETIKSNIEGQGGSYSFTIESGEAVVVAKKEITDLSGDEVEDIVTELEQTESVIKDTIKVDGKTEKKSEEKTFTSNEEADEYADNLVEENPKVTEATAILIDNGVTATQTDFKSDESTTDDEGHTIWTYDGYHIVELDVDESDPWCNKGLYKVVITGGLEEIKLDLAWFSKHYISQPGDEYEGSFIIENQSGDDYEIVDHTSTVGDIGRIAKASQYSESLGTKKYEVGNYVVYEPNVIHVVDGRNMFNVSGKPSAAMIKDLAIAYFYATDTNNDGVKDASERRAWAQDHLDITEEDLKKFYDDVTGVEHASAYEGWADFFNQYCWKTSFAKDDEKGTTGDEFFDKNLFDLSADSEGAQFKMFVQLDGPYTDNTYQSSAIRNIVELLTIRTLKKYRIDITEETYSITYNEEANGFVVTVNGSGNIPGGGGGDDPTPTPDPTPVITTPGEAPAVLGAQRELVAPEAPAVLGARRAGTSDETNMVLRLIVIAAAASVLVIAKKRAHN